MPPLIPNEQHNQCVCFYSNVLSFSWLTNITWKPSFPKTFLPRKKPKSDVVKYLLSISFILSSKFDFLTRALTFGILFSTALRALLIAKPAILSIFSLISLILA